MKHCPNTLPCLYYFLRYEQSLVVENINDGFPFCAYFNASNIYDVAWKNMEDGRGMD